MNECNGQNWSSRRFEKTSGEEEMIELRSEGHGGVHLEERRREWNENASAISVEGPCLVY